jgi:hypothetical protein
VLRRVGCDGKGDAIALGDGFGSRRAPGVGKGFREGVVGGIGGDGVGCEGGGD